MAASEVAQCVEQHRADVVAVGIGAHAYDFEAQSGLEAAELAVEHAGEDIAGETALVGDRKLCVRLRLAQRRAQAPLEVASPRVTCGQRIDRYDGVQVLARKGPNRVAMQGSLFHHGALPKSVAPADQVAA